MTSTDPQAGTLAAFNAASPGTAERDVLACCASGTFARAIADGRPYPDAAAVAAAADTAFNALSWDDIVEAMSGHPRIGDRVASGGWSAAEQSGAASAGEAVRQGLLDGNLAYEQRFGHVFLICASGLSGQDMLDQLHARLGHDPETERAVVREELLKITQLRLTKMLAATGPAGLATLSTHVLDATAGRPAAGVPVQLERRGPDGWSPVEASLTDADGRLRWEGGPGFEPGVYRITFGSGAYFEARGTSSFYPEVAVTFEITGRGEHYHVPLLLSPFAYSTYRGS
jgi:2-oxo-4-hydroxy-4-carboxy-5-ureidoimidazoline decarboxylase